MPQMPPKMTPKELKALGEKFAKALDKGHKEADAIIAQENLDAYEYGKKLERNGSYEKWYGPAEGEQKSAKAEESVASLVGDLRDLIK